MLKEKYHTMERGVFAKKSLLIEDCFHVSNKRKKQGERERICLVKV